MMLTRILLVEVISGTLFLRFLPTEKKGSFSSGQGGGKRLEERALEYE
jgi:hypothetical protein